MFAIRVIEKRDNAVIAKIIRDVLTEYNCNKPGTVFADPQTDFLFEQYTDNRTAYFVAELEGKIVGGAGIGKLSGLEDVCELQKMYLIPEARGKGIAKKLLAACTEIAKKNNFNKMYLETIQPLKEAIKFYEKNGFEYLQKPIISTGHFTCDVWMIKTL